MISFFKLFFQIFLYFIFLGVLFLFFIPWALHNEFVALALGVGAFFLLIRMGWVVFVKKTFAFKKFFQFLFAFILYFLVSHSLFTLHLVPSGSMIPTLLPGDTIFVNGLAYGIRLPFSRSWLTTFWAPKTGDIVVFFRPGKQQKNRYFVKRVMAIPGDHLEMKNGELKRNGEKLALQNLKIKGVSFENPCFIDLENREPVPPENLPLPYFSKYHEYEFWLEEGRHLIQRNKILFEGQNQKAKNNFSLTLPEDMYFVLGDNRDASDDSRHWGFLPQDHIIGKVQKVGLSFDDFSRDQFKRSQKNDASNKRRKGCTDPLNTFIRWHRFGKVLF